MKGCVISAPMTGSGKTTVTLGLLAALKSRGIRVQPFKVGPDFIDPGLHEIAAGVPSHNLDGWMLSRETNEQLFHSSATTKDVAIIEGVMGLFDGSSGATDAGSTAQTAKWLSVPVILVVDARAMARSAAALVQGFQTFDPEVRIAGIIFNRVAGERHFQILKDAVTSVPILGWLPANPSIEIPERHLGLLTAKEETTISRIRAIGRFFAEHINLDAILAVLREGAEGGKWGLTPPAKQDSSVPLESRFVRGVRPHFPRVALAHDKAFSFYYQANRLALEEAGAEIFEFSPLADRELPEADLLYVGGGYPELYRHELEANASMRASVKRFIESGQKFYAECGGLMYLAHSIDDAQMVGVVPAKI